MCHDFAKRDLIKKVDFARPSEAQSRFTGQQGNNYKYAVKSHADSVTQRYAILCDLTYNSDIDNWVLNKLYVNP